MSASKIPCLWYLLLVFSLIPLAAGEVRDRDRRSDDDNPLEVVVSTLSEKVERLTSQLTAQDTYNREQITSLQSRVGKLVYRDLNWTDE